ncbi:DUF397 domain-containing protein [Streptomyces sp. NPDC051018]|uniref:DUF397 domain-containing protein n=1 Tax=Streptomyces sp. NPDC051018 TaxID=3365639 RepID=UPI0037BDC091
MRTMQATERDGQLTWYTSGYSGSGGGNCVQVARDSRRDPRGGPAALELENQLNKPAPGR